MKRTLLLLVIVALISSCATEKICKQKFGAQVTSVKDSIVIKDSTVVRIKDSVYVNVKDSVVIKEGAKGKDSIPCNENSSQTIKRGDDVFHIKVKNGMVFFDYDLKGTVSHFNSVIDYKSHQVDSLSQLIQKQSTESVKILPAPTVSWWKAWLLKIWSVLELILAAIGLFYIIKTVIKVVIKTYFP